MLAGRSRGDFYPDSTRISDSDERSVEGHIESAPETQRTGIAPLVPNGPGTGVPVGREKLPDAGRAVMTGGPVRRNARISGFPKVR